MTLRLRVLLGLALVAAGIVVASLEITHVVRDTRAADTAVVDRWAPANSASDRLLSHLVDQETSERNYVITGDNDYLMPYTRGRQAAAQDMARIRTLVGGDATIAADITAVDDQWQRWLTDVAEPEIAAMQAGNVDRSKHLVENAVGQTLFDTLRTRMATLQADIGLQTAREASIEKAAIDRLDRAFLATLVIGGIFTVSFLLFVQLSVLRPLFALQDQLRRAAAGAFRDPIEQAGPPELREVASDVESLRTRLVRELEHSENVRQALEQRGPVVLGLSDRLSLAGTPAVPGLRIASALHAAEGVVAGDLLDVVRIDERQVAVVIADVSGHGAIAGLEAVSIKQVIGTALRLGKDPAGALDVAADHVRFDERFATCAIVVIDVTTGELTYANAGHLPPLIVPDGNLHDAAIDAAELRQLDPTGPLLSVLSRGWEVGRDQLRPGEILLLLTDGLLEARSSSGEEFGIDGLCKALSRATIRDVDTTVTALTAAVHAYADDYSRDDVTVLAVMRDVPTGQAPSTTSDDANSLRPQQRIDLEDPVDHSARGPAQG